MASLFKQDQICAQCGSKVTAGARFCPQCGAPQPGGDEVKCPRCDAAVSPAARFCPKCGIEVATAAPPALVSNRWEKIQNTFATRVDIEDLPGFFRKELIVEPGTHAIILVDGRTQGLVGPGRYTLQTLGDRLGAALTLHTAKRLTAILIDAGDVELPFEVPDLWTSDPLRVTLACRVVLRQQGAIEFLVNIMKGRSSYPLSEMRGRLYPEVVALAQDWVGRHTAQDLSQGAPTREAVEQALQIGLDRSLGEYGLTFVQLRLIALSCPPLEQRRAAREELLVALYETNTAVDQRVAELAKRQRLFDVTNADEVQALAEESAKVKIYEQRAAIKAQLQQAVLSAQFSEVKNEADFEARLREVDQQKALTEKDWDELKHSLAQERLQRDWNDADRQTARAHTLAKLELDRQYELKQAEFAKRTDFDRATLDAQLELERKRLDGQLDLQQKRFAAELDTRAKEADFNRAQANLDDVARREKGLQDAQASNTVALQNARTQIEITRLQAEQDRIDGELSILLLEKMQMRRVRVEAEKQALESKAKTEELERQLRLEEQRHRQEMERVAAAHAQELAILAQKGKLTPEQLIAVSPVDQARLIKELKETEARAVAEQVQAQSQQDQVHTVEFKQLYDQLLTRADQSAAAREAAAKETARMVQETAHKAIDSQREGMVEVARAVSHGQQPPTVVVAGSSGPQIIGGGSATSGGEVLMCPQCHSKSPVGTKFCQNCGHNFF